jgi:Na+/phosphate symporter
MMMILTNKNLEKIVEIICRRIRCIENYLSEFNKNLKKENPKFCKKLSSHYPSSSEHTDNDVS